MTDGDTDLTALISRRQKIAPVYQSHGTERIPTVITFDNETSEAFTVIDLETEDRVGLLYIISQAFNDLELDISVAKIVTEKGAAVDSFYVIDSDGTKIMAPDRQKMVERKLRQAILSGIKRAKPEG
jgi:[protein-PII] uridylyltransferase